MKQKYETVVALNGKGPDDAIEKLISQIGRDIEAEGARLEQIDQVGRRKLAYPPRHIDEGFYVSFQFEADVENLAKVRSKLASNPEIYTQLCQRLSA